MKASGRFEKAGSYSIEGALTLTIFTICMMALLSILSVMKVEGEVQDAINETALELSQYSYVLGRTEFLADAAEDHLEGLGMLVSFDGTEFSDLALTGPAVAKALTKSNFHRENADTWLKDQGVAGGYNGLDFRDTQVLLDGKNITVAVTYPLSVNTYGLFDKTLTLQQKAVTYALLPTDAALAARGLTTNTNSTSIWQTTNFVRGQYFAEEVRKEASGGKAVKKGQGIDLYDPDTGTYTEVYSVNLFSATYSTGTADKAASYVPQSDAIRNMLFGYAKDLRSDIPTAGRDVVLADGTRVAAVAPQHRVLVLVLPEETKDNKAMQTVLHEAATEAKVKYEVNVTFQYEQKALAGKEE